MSQVLSPDDARLAWQGAVSVEKTDQWVKPWRLQFDELELFSPEALRMRAGMPSGVRISFRSDTAEVAGRIVSQDDMAPIDLCCDGEVVGSVPMAGQEEFRFDGLPEGEHLIELWLPQFGEFRLCSLDVSDGAYVAEFEDDRPRWITYGSSITHCRQAESPTQTWPAIVARERGLNLTSFGYGGQCHLDQMVARMMRDLPADFVSCCFAANVFGSGSLGPRSFRPAVIGQVKTIRDGHPDIPIVLMSCICLSGREGDQNAVGFTLDAMREEVAAAVEALRACGDENVHYVSGLDVFGPDLAHIQPDGVHPNAEGYKVLGRNFLDKVVARYFPA